MLMHKAEELNVVGNKDLRLLHSVADGGKVSHISYYSSYAMEEVIAIEYNNYNGSFMIFRWDDLDEYRESINNEKWLFQQYNLLYISEELKDMMN